MNLRLLLPRDLTKTSDGTLTDHSISDQDSQSKELLKLLELTMLFLRDTLREELHSNSSSMELTRPSDPTTGRTTAWKSKAMEETPTLE